MVPLVAAGQAFGFMALRFAGTRVFAHAERELLLTFARQSGQALERARLYERERKAREWLGRLQAVTAAVSGASNVDDVGEAVIDQALVSLGASAGVVALVDRKGMLRQLAAGGADEPRLAARFPIEEVTQTRGLVVWPETPGCLASVPLLAGGRPIGALALGFKDRDELTASERDFLVALARLAAQALERSLLYQQEQLSRQAAERARDRVRKLEAVAQAGLAAKTLDDLLERLLPLLAGLFEADRAALLLVDEEQGVLRMRAAVGLDEAVQAQVRVPVGRGIAGRIAASGSGLLVEDVSAADPQSAYLREHGGSLLGVPLKAEGRVIGVLHVSSDRLSAFEDRDLRLLTVAGDRVALALERISLYEREHETAITLQRSVLPHGLPQVDRVQLAARYMPGSAGVEVGGDWYDALELGRGRLGLVVGDVVGKGVLAAAMTTQLRTALRVYALDGLDPAPVLAQLNRMAEITGPSFATLIYAVLDTESLICQFASAGHPPPLLVRANGPAEFLEGGRSVPLGIRTDIGYGQDAVQLDAGDTIVLFTDGLVERRGSTLDEGLQQLKSSAQHGPAEFTALLDHVLEALLSGDSPKDDIAILAVRAAPETS
jgi:GAF domain-containing protein